MSRKKDGNQLNIFEHGVPQTSISTCNSLQSMVAMVTRGAGIALLPENLVDSQIRRRELVPLADDLPPERLEFVIAHHRDQDQAIIRHIVELAVETSAFLTRPAAAAPAKTAPRRATARRVNRP